MPIEELTGEFLCTASLSKFIYEGEAKAILKWEISST